MKYVIFLSLIMTIVGAQNDCQWFEDSDNYFEQNCPIQFGDYNGCCLCTQVRFRTFGIIQRNLKRYFSITTTDAIVAMM